jgi:hypothetical protein
MKTAMQELKEALIKELKNNPFINLDITMFIPVLEKEKQQIINTYWDAYKEGQISSDVTAEEYYNEKYLK